MALVGLCLLSSPAAAFPRFGGSSGKSGCRSCHPWTKSPVTSPKGYTLTITLHDLHRGGAWMNNDCELCHVKGSYKNPYTNTSEGTPTMKGFGCAGCHGRVYKGKPKGYGLRAYHALKKIVVCASCHTSDLKPLPENVKPHYYGSSMTYVAFPCNNNTSSSEDWTWDGKGLDNDGDGLRDKADPDCKGCGTPTCASLGKNCGVVAVSCGGTLDCGYCNWPLSCGGGGKVNVCGAPTPDAGVPDVAVPDVAVPDMAVPDAAVPDAAVPDIRQPDAAPPVDMAVPDAPNQPDAPIKADLPMKADLANPDLPSPDLPGPDLTGPDLHVPDAPQPDVAAPDVAAPDVAAPDVAAPDMAAPDVALPDAPRPDRGGLDLDAGAGPDAPRPDISADRGTSTPPADDPGGCQLGAGAPSGIGLLFLLLALGARRRRR